MFCLFYYASEWNVRGLEINMVHIVQSFALQITT